jgi:hypothetical protein
MNISMQGTACNSLQSAQAEHILASDCSVSIEGLGLGSVTWALLMNGLSYYGHRVASRCPISWASPQPEDMGLVLQQMTGYRGTQGAAGLRDITVDF